MRLPKNTIVDPNATDEQATIDGVEEEVKDDFYTEQELLDMLPF